MKFKCKKCGREAKLVRTGVWSMEMKCMNCGEEENICECEPKK